MLRHSNRSAYFVIGEGILKEPEDLFGFGHESLHLNPPPCGSQTLARFKFGRLFRRAKGLTDAERAEMIKTLTLLGGLMNTTPDPRAGIDSKIPAGYTYLGQFIAHEITFDKSENLFEPKPISFRSPQIDLDSLYGDGPLSELSAKFYEADRTRLKIGMTSANNSLNKSFPNDLPRDDTKVAVISDPRNDENLAVAQTHVAFITFHNMIVEKLRNTCPDTELFERAKTEVVRHFHWIILEDYLPKIVDADVLDCVIRHGPRFFRVGRKEELFMPLEFSAAAFRLHSMVRARYEWNYYHSSQWLGGPPILSELFQRTRFSGTLGTQPTLDSEWVVDWRRFYDFADLDYDLPETPLNFASKIDPFFDFRLDQISDYPHHNNSADQRSITARNLLRGFALKLPTGEDVARFMGVDVLPAAAVAEGPYKELLKHPLLWGKTPLWFYILREAELRGRNGRLGEVGSRIVAETLVHLIHHSLYSRPDPSWKHLPSRRKSECKNPRFTMADLLDFAGVVNPIDGKVP